MPHRLMRELPPAGDFDAGPAQVVPGHGPVTACGPSATRTGGGVTRLVADLRSPAGPDGRSWALARVVVVADVVARSLRLQDGVDPAGVMFYGSASRSPVRAMAATRADLWSDAVSACDVRDSLCGGADIVVASAVDEADRLQRWRGDWTLPVADVEAAGCAGSDAHPSVWAGEFDPATLRLALLHFHPAEPALLSHGRLRRAEASLLRWRRKMGAWSDVRTVTSPRQRDVEVVRSAIGTDGDAVRLLRVLHRLERKVRVASSRKYEVFSFADEVLGLDLDHLVGKPQFW